MKEILIVSGKGGSGKTSLCACFARLAGKTVLADCDVDASNLPLLLKPEKTTVHEFRAGVFPVLDAGKCIHCGECERLCRFNAVSTLESGPEFLPGSCEGCGVCADACPAEAIALEPRLCGHWMRSETAYGPMFHAELLPGAENSGKLVAELRRAAKTEALEKNCEWLLSDGPPGIGCPVISAATGADFAVAVAEPTLSGLHDMLRLAQLLDGFEIPFALIINKSDLNPEISLRLEDFCRGKNAPLLGKIPFDTAFPDMLREGKTVLDAPDGAASGIIRKIWNNLQSTLATGGK